jgi:hypothetical protein
MCFTFKSIRAILPALALLFFCAGTLSAQDKITLGTVEEVILLPWGVKLQARVDSGAATTSLDARNLKVIDRTAEFFLPTASGGLELRIPIKRWVRIKSALGRQRRPIVELELCIGPKRVNVQANLADRSGLKYPILIGRNTLRTDFVIDCTQNMCAPPRCPEMRDK